MIHYILQVLLFQLLFLVVYDVFLKKETFFNYNRLYLLGTSLVSFVIPFLKIEAIQQNIPQEYRVQLPAVLLGNTTETTTNSSILLDEVLLTQQQVSWTSIVLGVYLLGVAVSIVLFLLKLRKLYVLKKSAVLEKTSDYTLANIPNSDVAFTFLNTVFLGAHLSERQRTNVLQHELVHVQQYHTLDLLFFEMLRILFWFNPLVYVFQLKIQALHEYTADRLVASKDKIGYYQNLLSEVFGTTKISFINTFYTSSILKNRIVMLQKSNSKKIVQLKYLLLIPAVCAMIFYTSCSEDTNPQSEEQDLAQFTYSMKLGGGDMTPENEELRKKFETFMRENNSTHVAWVVIKDGFVESSIHSVDEQVPEIYDGDIQLDFVDGTSYKGYIYYEKNNDPKNKSLVKKTEYRTLEDYPKNNENNSDVPFSVIQKVPTYPGCEGTNEEMKQCMAKQIRQFVGENFNTKLANKLEFTGKQRISVQFTINKDGYVADARARAAHPDLETEALRVVSKLPKMIPGEKDGKPVGVIYALPIIFEVNE